MADTPKVLARRFAADVDTRIPHATRVQIVAQLVGTDHPKLSKAVLRAVAEAALTSEPEPDSSSGPESTSGTKKTAPRRRKKRRVVAAPLTPAKSPRGLVFQALGLVALYWVLRTPSAVSRLTGGTQRAFQWLSSTRGIPSR